MSIFGCGCSAEFQVIRTVLGQLASEMTLLVRRETDTLVLLGEMARRQQRLERNTELMLAALREIQKELAPKVPTKMALQFEGGIPNMAGQETDVQTIPCTALETDADGNPVALNPANVVWAIDDPTLAEVTQNTDGSAQFKALKVGGPATVSCTDNGQTPPLVGTNTLTVVASTKTPTSMALVFGDPQAATA